MGGSGESGSESVLHAYPGGGKGGSSIHKCGCGGGGGNVLS